MTVNSENTYNAKHINSNMPSFYTSAEEISGTGQKEYLRLMRTDIGVMLIGALFASFSGLNSNTNFFLLVMCAICIGIGMLITIYLSRSSYRKDWHIGRAVAEAIKSLSWRYMMNADPFQGEANDNGMRNKLIDELDKVLEDNDFKAVIQAPGDQITSSMQELREQDRPVRQTAYLEARIIDQQKYYYGKSKMNAKQKDNWYFIIAGTQLLTLIVAIVIIFVENSIFNPTGFLSAVAASGLAWLQIKKYEELSLSYRTVANELSLQRARLVAINSEDDFAAFVAKTEESLQNEHKHWLTQREPELVNSFG